MTALAFSLVFMTGRADPRFDWILEALDAQLLPDERCEIIVVDGYNGKPGRSILPRMARAASPIFLAHGPPCESRFGLAGAAAKASRISICCTKPKPNIWQGQYRVTDRDWWATSNARNTAIAIATHDYIAFLDDRSRLGPDWLPTIRRGFSERASVLAGSYEKYETTGTGIVKLTHDHRREHCPDGKINCGGGWLYGCTFALPLAWLLECNGLEEGCDGLTGEDYILGLMLENNGRRIDFEPRLFVSQDRTEGTEHGFAMKDKGIAPNDKSNAALARFGSRKRTEFTPDLTALRARLATGEPWPVPSPAVEWRDWYDGQLVADMRPPP